MVRTLRQILYLTVALATLALVVLSVHELVTPPHEKHFSIPVNSN
jgi:hypothetical protein